MIPPDEPIIARQLPSQGLSPEKSSLFSSVPRFRMYFPSISTMNDSARAFYTHWLESWSQGRAVDVEGNISYLFVYTYEVLAWYREERFADILEELAKLRAAYAKEPKFADYLLGWIADTHVLLGDIESALRALSGISNQRSIISLKLYLKQDVIDLVAPHYFSPLTDIGKANTDQVRQIFVKLFRERVRSGEFDLEWVLEATSRYPLYSGSWSSHPHPEIPYYKLTMNASASQQLCEMRTEAEDQFRESKGIPHIGEGWVSEAQLKYFVEELLKPLGHPIEFHARPDWLEGQELDIYVPSLNLAIEYMGEQHYKPVEIFGGDERFQKTRERDEIKARLCKGKGVLLLYYRFDEPLDIDRVRRRLADHPDLTVQLLSKSAVELPKSLPSYAQAKEVMAEVRKEAVTRQQLPLTSVIDVELPESERWLSEGRMALLEGDFEEASKCVDRAKRADVERSGLNLDRFKFAPVSSEQLKHRLDYLSPYLEAEPELKRCAQAAFAISLSYRPLSYRPKYNELSDTLGEVLILRKFQICHIPWEQTFLKQPFLLKSIESCFNLDCASMPPEAMEQHIQQLLLEDLSSAAVTGIQPIIDSISLQARRLLFRRSFVRRPTMLHKVKWLSKYSRRLYVPNAALDELVEAGLAVDEKELTSIQLLDALTIPELRGAFPRKDVAQGSRKADVVISIASVYSPEEIRDVVLKELSARLSVDRLFALTLDGWKIPLTLLPRQATMIHLLVGELVL